MGREKQSAPDVDEATSEQFSWSADWALCLDKSCI